MELPPWALVIGEAPHDWLLPQCAAVVHHGGAGTVAAGLSAACPTTVIYFFGGCPPLPGIPPQRVHATSGRVEVAVLVKLARTAMQQHGLPNGCT